MKKRIFMVYLFCIFFMLETPAYAYLDPSTGSYVIQVIAGVVLAAGASIAYYWKRIINRFTGKGKKNEE